MTRLLSLLSLLTLVGLLLVAGCPGGAPPDTTAAVSGCVERPGELPRPPAPQTGALPCELIPPTLNLQTK